VAITLTLIPALKLPIRKRVSEPLAIGYVTVRMALETVNGFSSSRARYSLGRLATRERFNPSTVTSNWLAPC